MASLVEIQRLLESATGSGQVACGSVDFDNVGKRLSDTKFPDRLRRRLAEFSSGKTGFADFAALLRQALLKYAFRRQASQGDSAEVSVRISTDRIKASREDWHLAGFKTQSIGTNRIRISPELPITDNLGYGADRVVAEAIMEVPRRRAFDGPDLDPVVSMVMPGWRSYASIGQREAIRAAFLSPEGEAVVVNLPTGSGKSAAFHVPALVAARKQDGVVVVVVPTVALARDQELRFRHEAHEAGISVDTIPLAYHSGLTSAQKDATKAALSEGRLPVLFTSPEVCLNSLASSLLEAARRRQIKLFAIDEAHIVASWGDGFRPEFQAMAGLWRHLGRCQKESSQQVGKCSTFRTLLLTATLTRESLDTLSRLFSPTDSAEHIPRSLSVVSDTFIRPEPSYLITAELSPESRRSVVLQSLRFLPRPLLLYVTRPEEAHMWTTELRQTGFLSVDSVVGGDMSTVRGENLLARWNAGDLDVVVATSAFGLGVDQSHVRSVVHACVPESLDRFYQEVGRGGRDGRACVSLLAWTREDVRVAESLVRETEISAERGLERWSAMLNNSRDLADDIVSVDLDAFPDGYTLSSQRNVSWNYRTLLRMARCGFIEFAFESPARQSSGVLSPNERVGMKNRAAVRIMDSNHQLAGEWQHRFENQRGTLLSHQHGDVEKLWGLLSGSHSVSELLAETYSIPEVGIRIAGIHGDCQVKRRNGDWCHDVTRTPPIMFDTTHLNWSASLQKAYEDCFGGKGTFLVLYEPASDSSRRGLRPLLRDMRRLASLLAANGMVSFSVPNEWFREGDWKALADSSPFGFVIDDSDSTQTEIVAESYPSVVVVSSPPAGGRSVPSGVLPIGPERILVMPRTTSDPVDKYRKVTARRHVTLAELMKEMNQ